MYQLLLSPIEDIQFIWILFSTLTMCEQDACGMDHTRMVASVDPVKPRSYNKIDNDRYDDKNCLYDLILQHRVGLFES